MTVDGRLPLADRLWYAMVCWTKPACCLSFYMAARLQAKLTAATDIMNDFFSDFLWWWCWSFDLGIADVEDRHGRNKAQSEAGMTVPMFNAKYINAEGKHLSECGTPRIHPLDSKAEQKKNEGRTEVEVCQRHRAFVGSEMQPARSTCRY